MIIEHSEANEGNHVLGEDQMNKKKQERIGYLAPEHRPLPGR